jgi:hypothetical protein
MNQAQVFGAEWNISFWIFGAYVKNLDKGYSPNPLKTESNWKILKSRISEDPAFLRPSYRQIEELPRSDRHDRRTPAAFPWKCAASVP